MTEADDRSEKLRRTIEGRALGLFEEDGSKTLVLYDPKAMAAAVGAEGGPDSDEMARAIEGIIKIEEPVYGQGPGSGSCHDAWEVTRSGVRSRGSGVGGLLYKLAAAASPSGRLMPDRRSVSPAAQKLWGGKRRDPELQFDDEAADPEERRTPDDPTDDCMVHDYDRSEGPGSNPLNYAYELGGAEVDVAGLSQAHEEFMRRISGETEADMDALFKEAARKAFEEFVA